MIRELVPRIRIVVLHRFRGRISILVPRCGSGVLGVMVVSFLVCFGAMWLSFSRFLVVVYRFLVARAMATEASSEAGRNTSSVVLASAASLVLFAVENAST